MQEVLWTIFGWICKGIAVLALISIVWFSASFIWVIVTNGGRKWYYYNPSKPWKGGYWTPLLPDYSPYNEYRWNPETCRFEHKETGEPLYLWEKSIARRRSQERMHEWDWDALGISEDKPITFHQHKKQKNKRPKWVRFLLEENIGTFIEKRRRKKCTGMASCLARSSGGAAATP